MSQETDRYVRRIPDDLWQAVRVEATSRKQEIREVVIAALRRFLGKDQPTETKKGDS